MFKNLFILTIIVAFAVTFAIGYWINTCETYLKNNYVTLELHIEKGESFSETYNKIFKHMDTPPFFKNYLKYVYHFAGKRKFGYYKTDNLPLNQLIENINNGKQYNIKVTFPEGYNIYDIAKQLDKAGIIKYSAFIDNVTNEDFVKNITGKQYPSLEGFLYPDTYYFPKSADPADVAKLMYQNFLQMLPENFESKVNKYGLDMYEGVILASIVQKETYSKSEYPIVASVFYNRLRKGMRLQSDPTIIYGVYPIFDGNLQDKHLENAGNPYNTYQHSGLPPTPICSPSKGALKGVANPADTDYLYFVAGENGSHLFSETYREHVNKVNRHQK
ncbi:aminodeoxychorismate lyase [Flexistipes sinusarabici DSM 4947]|uniref:Endolytic murein transglycosylase n=1 Tax=Flexistipes sinusarabici (strain ATCC 49648 / DSM 4947 / MAS 10) TaxID=717231 RepID=F8E4C1_FLESM|nr:endolytic transglycosylase MltG [Flexistipes sinusarabici]AEI15548.1 aminodeoxychorismate lyase [Flexistipes sinusarabici DSM 4947]